MLVLQYEECSSKSPACANYSCDHKVTSFYARAKDVECQGVLEALDQIGMDKV